MNTKDLLDLIYAQGWHATETIRNRDGDAWKSTFKKEGSSMTVIIDYSDTRFTASFDGKRWRNIDYTRTSPSVIKNILTN